MANPIRLHFLMKDEFQSGGVTMTELRQRMIESLQLRGLSERTQEAYVRAVRQLAEHYHKSPDLITEEELRQYFLFIKNVKHYSRNTMTIAICGIRFLYQHALNRDWSIFGIVRPAPEKKLPVILSGAEVRKVLSLIRLPRYKVCLSIIYSCGLRLQEGINLHVADIDSGRMDQVVARYRAQVQEQRAASLPGGAQRKSYQQARFRAHAAA